MRAACVLAWHNVHSSASCRSSLYTSPSIGSVSLPTWWPSTSEKSSEVDTWPCEVGPVTGRVHLADSFKFSLEEGDLSHAPLGPFPRASHSSEGDQESILLYPEKYENTVQSGGHGDEQNELEAGGGNDNHISKSFSDTSVMPDGRFAHRDTDSEQMSSADQEEEDSSEEESDDGVPSHADSSTVVKSAGYIEKPDAFAKLLEKHSELQDECKKIASGLQEAREAEDKEAIDKIHKMYITRFLEQQAVADALEKMNRDYIISFLANCSATDVDQEPPHQAEVSDQASVRQQVALYEAPETWKWNKPG